MNSNFVEPLNIGSEEMVSINQLVDIVEKIAGIRLKRTYKRDAPMGVRGRNSENTLIREVLGWSPSIKLADGMEKTYRWIYLHLINSCHLVLNRILQSHNVNTRCI